MKSCTGVVSESGVLFVNCDFDGDGKINTKDLSALKKRISGNNA